MATLAGARLRIARALKLPSSVPIAKRSHDSLPKKAGYSPALRFDDCYVVASRAIRAHAKRVRRGKFLDVGGSAGAGKVWAGPFQYVSLDPVPQVGDWFIQGDICACPQIPDETFEVVYSHRMMEFVAEPWLAAGEMGRILRSGGIVIVIACFAWRYHPGLPDGSQPDYWRYTHDGLSFIFEKYGRLETVETGYDLRNRREDVRGGKIAGGLDIPPIDELGGFRENWTVWWIGRKP